MGGKVTRIRDKQCEVASSLFVEEMECVFFAALLSQNPSICIWHIVNKVNCYKYIYIYTAFPRGSTDSFCHGHYSKEFLSIITF